MLHYNCLPLNYSSGIATTTHQTSESSRSHVRHGSRKGVEQVEIDVPNPPQMKPVVLRSAKHVSALHSSHQLIAVRDGDVPYMNCICFLSRAYMFTSTLLCLHVLCRFTLAGHISVTNCAIFNTARK